MEVSLEVINYISITAVPFVIFFIISYGLSEKIKVFDSFLVGCKEGIITVIKIFPILIALFLEISMLENSGIFNLLGSIFSPFLNVFKIPSELLPLILVRPISGSASTAVAMNIMETYGVDTLSRFNCFYYYGFYRNYSLHYCYLHKCCWYKKNKVCFNCFSYK